MTIFNLLKCYSMLCFSLLFLCQQVQQTAGRFTIIDLNQFTFCATKIKTISIHLNNP